MENLLVKNDNISAFLTSRKGAKLLEEWAENGLSYEQMCEHLAIDNRTFHDMRQRYPEIQYALASGKINNDYKVENALLRSALGGTTKTTEILTVFDGDNRVLQIQRKETESEVQPNIGAIKMWLENRRPDKWYGEKGIDTDDNASIKIEIIPAKLKELETNNTTPNSSIVIPQLELKKADENNSSDTMLVALPSETE